MTTPISVASVSHRGLTAGWAPTPLFTPAVSGTFQINASMLVNGLVGDGGVPPVLSVTYHDGSSAQTCQPLEAGTRMGGDGRLVGVLQITCSTQASLIYSVTIQGSVWPTYDFSIDLYQLL